MIKYHLYRNYFPLSALGRYAQSLYGEVPPEEYVTGQGGIVSLPAGRVG